MALKNANKFSNVMQFIASGRKFLCRMKKNTENYLKNNRKHKMSTQHDEVGNPPFSSIWGHCI